MRKIGLIGGMSWESTVEYYKIMNQAVMEELGGHHSAEIIMYSVDFQPMHELQFENRWEEMGRILTDIAKTLEKAGADFLVIATNTMHKLAPEVERNVKIPLLHIADATAEKIKEKGVKRVGLLGTKFTMEMDFYRERLTRHGIETLVPPPREREYINRVIYEELVKGIIREESRRNFLKIIDSLVVRGAEGVILGCTEIPLLIKQEHVKIPLFNTTEIHARAAVKFALQD